MLSSPLGGGSVVVVVIAVVVGSGVVVGLAGGYAVQTPDNISLLIYIHIYDQFYQLMLQSRRIHLPVFLDYSTHCCHCQFGVEPDKMSGPRV